MNFETGTFSLVDGMTRSWECSDCKILFEYNILVRFNDATRSDGAVLGGINPKFCPNCGSSPEFLTTRDKILPYT